MRARPHLLRCALVLGFGLSVAASGCGAKAPEVTGLTVTMVFPGIDADQLELSVLTTSGEALAPKRRPVDAGTALSSPQSVSIYLPDTLADQDVTCRVTAYSADRPTATGTAPAKLALKKLVPVTVELRAAAGDAGAEAAAMDAADASADGTEAGTDVAGDAPTDGAVKAIGQACATGAECDSSLCVGNVCCTSPCNGVCEACNIPGKVGTCSPVAAGTKTTCVDQGAASCGYDGTCDGNGACRRYQAGMPCKAASCLGSKLVPASACDGQGTCKPANDVDCTPYVCDATGAEPACRTTCRAGAADCVSPAVCTNASCGAKPKKGNGAGCVDATECSSGFCADGVCCNAACTGACVSCSQPATLGMCAPLATGKTDPHKKCADMGAASCGTNGLCDGAGGCALYPTTTTCGAGSCSGRMLHATRRCDGKGVCLPAEDVDCLPYRCDAASTACFMSCTSNAQCSASPRRQCQNNGTCG